MAGEQIDLTIEESMLAALDRVAADLGTTRTAFIHDVVKMAVRRHEIRQLEARDAAGYRALPAPKTTDDPWTNYRDWGDGPGLTL